MQFRTFVADTMPQALDRIRKALGPDAVLLHTRMIARNGRRRVEIAAACDPIPEAGIDRGPDIDGQAWRHVTGELEGARRQIDDLRRGDPLARWLRDADFLPAVAETLYAEARGKPQPLEQIALSIAAAVKPASALLPLPDQSRRIALIGPPGAGKTTALVKLAAQAASSPRTDIVLVNLDSYRPGAEEYLSQVGDTLRVPVLFESTREVQKGMPEAEGLVLIDTDARMWAADPGAVAVRATLKRLQPDAVALVLPAVWRSSDLQDAFDRYQSCRPTHLVFSGLDLTSRYGGILSIACVSELPVACVVTTGRFDSGTRMFRPEGLLQQMQALSTMPASGKESTRV